MKTCNDITFIDSYWKELDTIYGRIRTELPKIDNNNIVKKIGKYLHIIKFSNLDDWSAHNLLESSNSKLYALADKLISMIKKGDAPNVIPFLKRICFKGIKKLSQPQLSGNAEFLGYGHFRWNYGNIYVLNENEIARIINYFDLTE